MESMKVHNFARGRFWEHETLSLTLGCKHLHPLAPKISNSNITTTTSSFDLKSFIKSESGSKKLGPSYDDNKRDSPSPKDQVETHGGTRWNPTQEQIRILEMLYRGGMRTPNTQKIEQITVQLSKYGKIEGKNVFYWFQNHKARERQKQKRKTLSLPLTPHTLTFTLPQLEVDQEDSSYKKCRSMAFEYFEDQNWSSCKDQEHKTLELFPLHPELGK